MSRWSRITSTKGKNVHLLPHVQKPVAAAPPSTTHPCLDDVTMDLPPVDISLVDNSEEIDAIVNGIPKDAVHLLDEWAKAAMKVHPGARGSGTSPLQQRKFSDCQMIAQKWLAMRASIAECVLAADGTTSPETVLLDTFFEEVAFNEWMYRDWQVFAHWRGHVSLRGSLDYVLHNILDSSSRTTQDHFSKIPSALLRVADVIDETFTRDNRCLQVDCTRIRFENGTAQLSARGIDVIASPPLFTDGPVVARASLSMTLDIEDFMRSSWTAGDFIHPSLLSFVGAMLRPACIRRDDSRPLLLIATCPPTFIHPIVAMLRTFCHLSITTKLDLACKIGPPELLPYVYEVDAEYSDITEEVVNNIRSALHKDMVVVVRAPSIPALLLADGNEYVRLCAVHVHADEECPAHLMRDVDRHILPASQAWYRREPPESKRALSFLCHPDLYQFRVSGPSSAFYIFLEMLQCRAGIELRSKSTVSYATVLEAYDKYARRRLPTAPYVESLSIEDTVRASRYFREMFGHRITLSVVVFFQENASFLNMAAHALP